MTRKVVEPSEIFMTEESSYSKPPLANPSVRFLARCVDYSLFFVFLWILKTFFQIQFSSNALEKFIPLEFFSWIPFEAFFLKIFGKTFGKWFLNIEMRFNRKKRPDWVMALRRSISVWFRGLGMGLPVVNFFCLLVAYQRLKVTQTTSWDRDDHIEIIHHHLPKWRLIVAAVFSVLGFCLYFFG